MSALKHISDTLGVSILLAEQNAGIALEIADYGYVLENGRVAHQGTPAELRADSTLQGLYLGLGQEQGYMRSPRAGVDPRSDDSPARAFAPGARCHASFAGLVVLNGISLDVYEGQIVGMIGPNRAGKSSLLNCINNFYVPDAGQITYRGTNLLSLRPSAIPRLGIARTFQGLELVPRQTVLENVLLGRYIHGRTGVLAASVFYGRGRRDERTQRLAAEKTLDSCGLLDLKDARAGNLPYGQQKHVTIARALAMEPELLLLDEPTSGLTVEDKGASLRSCCSDQG